MKTSEVIVLGGGIIGLSLALELRRRDFQVLLLERGEPGHEASYAAAGMLSPFGPEHSVLLEELSLYSWELYPEFIRQVVAESGISVMIHSEQSILVGIAGISERQQAWRISPDEARALQPGLNASDSESVLLEERYLDPRELLKAMVAAAHASGADVYSGAEVTGISAMADGMAVTTTHAKYFGKTIVNCCGAWAGSFGPAPFPSRPRKGQMLAVAPATRGLLRRTVRDKDVYLVPRDDGRIVVGATVEDAGFDKRVEPEIIQKLYRAAVHLLPDLAEARILEAWAGLRPGTPDDLPIMGNTRIPGYYVSTGHFRNGILLAPASAQVVADVICGRAPKVDIGRFSAARFEVFPSAVPA